MAFPVPLGLLGVSEKFRDTESSTAVRMCYNLYSADMLNWLPYRAPSALPRSEACSMQSKAIETVIPGQK
jgi:hypothetical protein